MDMIEAVRRALAELGEVKAEDLAAFVKARYGVTVQAKFVPIIKATLRDEEMLAASRQRRAADDAPMKEGTTSGSGTPA